MRYVDGEAVVRAHLDRCTLYLDAGHWALAFDAAQEAKKEAAALLPAYHPLATECLRAAGIAAAEKGAIREAEVYFELLAERFTDEDPRRAIAWGDLAHVALARRNPALAEELLERAIDHVDAYAEDPRLLVEPYLAMLAALKAEQSDSLPEARRLSARMLDISIATAGEAALGVAEALMFGALLDLKSGDPKGGRALAAQAADIFGLHDEAAERRALSLRLVAEAYRLEGRTGDAEEAEREAQGLWPEGRPQDLDRELDALRETFRVALRRRRIDLR